MSGIVCIHARPKRASRHASTHWHLLPKASASKVPTSAPSAAGHEEANELRPVLERVLRDDQEESTCDDARVIAQQQAATKLAAAKQQLFSAWEFARAILLHRYRSDG